MSLKRLIFYSAMIGGWAAFVGWMVSEIILFRRTVPEGVWGFLVIMLTCALVGGCVAGGLTLLSGVASGSLAGQWTRFVPGFLGGLLGGGVGGMLGNALTLVLRPWIFLLVGWILMGLAIGAVEGIYDKSSRKLRNGLIGGGVGGLLGGIVFTLLGASSMADRATGFVVLGLCIGFFIGLAQVVLKEAWLTVEDGFRPGRQLVLSMPETIMGTSEKAALPFIAFGAKGVEPIHVRIVRRDDGTYLLQDNNSRTGTFVNGQQVQGAVVLKNEDVIKLGVNVVRFRETHKHVVGDQPAPAAVEAPRPTATPIANPPTPAIAVAAAPPPGSESDSGAGIAGETGGAASARRAPAQPDRRRTTRCQDAADAAAQRSESSGATRGPEPGACEPGASRRPSPCCDPGVSGLRSGWHGHPEVQQATLPQLRHSLLTAFPWRAPNIHEDASMSKNVLDGLVAGGLAFALLCVIGLDKLLGKRPEAGESPTTFESEPTPVRKKMLRLGVSLTSNPEHDWDKMPKLLDDLGSGYRYVQVPVKELYDPKRFEDIDVLFFTCSPEGNDQAMADNLRKFVSRGGTLYASDWRFKAVELAFPEMVNRKAVGDGNFQDLMADVIDPGLQDALGMKRLPLHFNLEKWKTAAFGGPRAKILIKARYRTQEDDWKEAPLLVKFPFGEGTVIFTSFHNEAQNSAVEQKLLKFLVFSAVTAQIENDIHQTMVKGGFSPQKSNLLSASGKSEMSHVYKSKKAGKVRFMLGFQEGGARLKLTVVSPDGKQTEKEGTSNIVIEQSSSKEGDWHYTVTALSVSAPNFPFTLTVGEQQ